jgi:hypothetical protein
MMSEKQELLENGLPKTYRFITDHDQEAKAVFSTRVTEEQPFRQISDEARFALNFTTRRVPVSFESDLSDYQKDLSDPPGIMIPAGSVLRVVDMAPGATSPMHRTVSLDYGVVLEGEVWIVLDSGEERLMRRGDISIQRGTNHAWRNNSATEWARMMYVLLEARALEINGKQLEEDYGVGMGDVKPSR